MIEEPHRPRVKFQLPGSFGKPGELIGVDWPTWMPFPSTGDRIVTGRLGGFVRAIEYRPLEKVIVYQLG